MSEINELEHEVTKLSGGRRVEDELKHDVDIEAGRGNKPTVASVVSEDTISAEKNSGKEAVDPDVVYWDGRDDPENPQNWATWRKAVIIGITSFITFVTPLASSMFAPGVPELMREFHSTNETLGSFVVTVFLLGFAFGPLIIAPCSELWGRFVVFNITNVCFLLFTIACALAPSFNSLIAFRFLAGCFGSAPLAIGGGTITDVTYPEGRGVAMLSALFALGPLLGPAIGPVISGFLTKAEGWRWNFWLLAILSGIVTISTPFFLRETFHPLILRKKAERLRKETGNPNLRSKLDANIPVKEVFVRAFTRPLRLLFTQPLVFSFALFVAVVYAYIYLLFTTFTLVFEEQYHFSPNIVGLSYLGLGIGNLIGLAIIGNVSDRLLVSMTKKSGTMKPEYRLPPMIYTAPTLPIGLFWYGWTAFYKVHWIVPIIGTSFVGIGMIGCFMCINTYIVDTYTIYAASGIAATSVLRSVFGALLPLAGPAMYSALGLGWGNSLLAFIAVGLLPIPLVFVKYGEAIRMKYPVKFD